jgi:hypothetical protein
MRIGWTALFLMLAAMPGAAPAAPVRTIATLALQQPFATRTPWRFIATQGPDQPDPVGYDDPIPGIVTPCLKGPGACDPALVQALALPGHPDDFGEAHYLNRAAIVHPRPDLPLLLVQLASRQGGNGDQRVATQLFAYDRAADRFVLAYGKITGRNNNQEIRYVEAGPLQGAIIASEPTDDAPFGYWITVSRLDAAHRYTQRLRYRSATRYGDGNPLAVIDSEMPGILQRLSLWKPGAPLPAPADCARPHLVKGALWCR